MDNNEQNQNGKKGKLVDKILGIIDFSLAIYLVYYIIAMLAE